jgi:hypothetical protein
VKHFEIHGGYEPGEHPRDFVEVGDAVAPSLWLVQILGRTIILNIRTGQAHPLKGGAVASINGLSAAPSAPPRPRPLAEHAEAGVVGYVNFADLLVGNYPCSAPTDPAPIRRARHNHKCASVAHGVGQYASWLLKAV